MQDLFVSAWVRVGNRAYNRSVSGSKMTMVTCQKSVNSLGFDMAIIRDRLAGDIGYRASVQSGLLSTQLDKVQQQIDLRGWNHFAMYIDNTRNLRISINSAINNYTYLGSSNVLFNI